MTSLTFSFLGTKQLSGQSANSCAGNRIKTSSVSSLVFVCKFNVCKCPSYILPQFALEWVSLLEFYCG